MRVNLLESCCKAVRRIRDHREWANERGIAKERECVWLAFFSNLKSSAALGTMKGSFALVLVIACRPKRSRIESAYKRNRESFEKKKGNPEEIYEFSSRSALKRVIKSERVLTRTQWRFDISSSRFSFRWRILFSRYPTRFSDQDLNVLQYPNQTLLSSSALIPSSNKSVRERERAYRVMMTVLVLKCALATLQILSIASFLAGLSNPYLLIVLNLSCSCTPRGAGKYRWCL